MKSSFKKFLPIVAAVLLATSCGKDDDSNVASVDEVTIPDPVQEVVDNTTKTITITGKVSKESLSKVTVDGGAFAYQPGDDVFAFNDATHGVSGSITITATDGSYTASITYTDESALTSNTFTATLGNNPTGLSTPYDNIETAVQNARYEIPFKVTGTPGSYSLKREDGTGDVLVYIKSAFIKSLATRTIQMNGSDVNVAIDKFYVVSIENVMGTGTTNPVPGKVYTVNKLAGKISYGDGEVSVTKKLYEDGAFTQEFDANDGDGTITFVSSDPSVATVNETTGEVKIKKAGSTTITATAVDGYAYHYDEGNKTTSFTVNVTIPTEYVDFGVTNTDGLDVYWRRNKMNGIYDADCRDYAEAYGKLIEKSPADDFPTIEEARALLYDAHIVLEHYRPGEDDEMCYLRIYKAKNDADKNFGRTIPEYVTGGGTASDFGGYGDNAYTFILLPVSKDENTETICWLNNSSVSGTTGLDVLKISRKGISFGESDRSISTGTPTPLIWTVRRSSK